MSNNVKIANLFDKWPEILGLGEKMDFVSVCQGNKRSHATTTYQLVKLLGKNNVYPNRVKVRVVGYHDQIEDDNELPFASVTGNAFMATGYGSGLSVHQLEGGESVLGVWLDGDDEQKPVITNVFLASQSSVDGKTKDLKLSLIHI